MNNRSGSFFSSRNTTPVSLVETEFKKIFNEFDPIVAEKLHQSKIDDKKLIILVGKNGREKLSFLVEVVLLAIAIKYHIKDLILEGSSSRIHRLALQNNEHRFPYENNWIPITLLIQLANHCKFNVLPAPEVDHLPQDTRYLDWREMLDRLNSHAMFVLDVKHLGLIQSENNKYDLLLINSTTLKNENLKDNSIVFIRNDINFDRYSNNIYQSEIYQAFVNTLREIEDSRSALIQKITKPRL